MPIESTPDNVAFFWARVAAGDDDACWHWQGPRTSAGYGVIARGHQGRRGTMYAHRFAWMLHHGTIPPGAYVCHRCDTPVCVNPHHLFVGTQSDNMRDARAKGRVRGMFRPGERRWSKLTPADVLAIRARYANGEHQTALGRAFGVTQANISEIVRGRTWHLTDGPEPAEMKAQRQHDQQHDPGERKDIDPEMHHYAPIRDDHRHHRKPPPRRSR